MSIKTGLATPWDFKVRGFAGSTHPHAKPGTLLLETAHKGESSASVEIDTWQGRMKRGDASRAELIDLRPNGTLTNLNVYADTKIPWSWKK